MLVLYFLGILNFNDYSFFFQILTLFFEVVHVDGNLKKLGNGYIILSNNKFNGRKRKTISIKNRENYPE